MIVVLFYKCKKAGEYRQPFLYYNFGGTIADNHKCYQQALAVELSLRGIPFEREKHFDLYYKGVKLDLDYIADFVVDDKIIIELKAVRALDDAHRAQLHNYLNISHLKLGVLVNFYGTRAEIERIVK